MNKYFLSITGLPFLSVRNLIHIMNRSFLRTGKIIALAIVSSLLISCNEISFNMPNGPQGEAGRSAYEVWKDEVLSGKIQWPNDKVELTDFFFFCKGEKGDKGDNGLSAYEMWKGMVSQGDVANPHDPSKKWPKDSNTEPDFWNFLVGRDGNTPYIGSNGNWFIGNNDTGVGAKGEKGAKGDKGEKGDDGVNGLNGKDGKSAYEQWKNLVEDGTISWDGGKEIEQFFLYLKGAKGDKGDQGEKGEDGQDGLTPRIGENGNWWIGDTDTNIKAAGDKGDKGDKGDQGETGATGADGKSAYQLWKDDVAAGKITDPKTGEVWPATDSTQTDFYRYLRGADGAKGAQGDKGDKGEKGAKGDNGLSAYEMWKEMVSNGDVDNPHDPGEKWPADKNTEPDFWNFLIGRDGNSPYIGSNGNWFIGGKDTGVGAKGEKGVQGDKGEKGDDGVNGLNGKDGKSAYEQWKNLVEKDSIHWTAGTNIEHFFQYLKGAKGDQGENGENGKDGLTPRIGENGNWWIGDTDTNIKAIGDKGDKGDQGETGATGATGATGKSAYELWKDDVAAGNIKDPKTGETWPATDSTQTDFYRYLKGADGAKGDKGDKGDKGERGLNGKSAYEVWKEMVSNGDVDNPQKPGEKWPADKVSENNFFEFLTGKDGAKGLDGLNGKDGKSAYEVWKYELEVRYGTSQQLKDPKTGEVWPKEKNSVDDFLEYLRGKDGKDGEDGRPGKPGEPGVTVVVVKGYVNVIAQYSNQAVGEYVRTSDGGVRYLVFDEEGQAAPEGTIVKGMPGLSYDKTYTTDADGAFIIPKEDLPDVVDMAPVDRRWGKVSSVKFPGKEPKESTKNTYVPCRVHTRMILSGKPYLSYDCRIYFHVQRKLTPNSDWESIPGDLPALKSTLTAYEVKDKTDPSSYDVNKVIGISSSNDESIDRAVGLNIRRHVKNNVFDIKNSYDSFWDGKDHYYTVIRKDTYYGEEIKWNGVGKLAPVQAVPPLKKIVLRRLKNVKYPYFEEVECTFDTSYVDRSLLFKDRMAVHYLTNGMEYTEPELYSKSEANEVKALYVVMGFDNLELGEQYSSNEDYPSTIAAPVGKIHKVYLGSMVNLGSKKNHLFLHHWYRTVAIGSIQSVAGKTNEFYLKREDFPNMPDVEVVYEP